MAKPDIRDIVNGQADVVKSTQIGTDKFTEMQTGRAAHMLVLPNVYFHLSIAYGILRKEGVPLGKMDYFKGYIPEGF